MSGRVLEQELARLLDLGSHENRISLLKGIRDGKSPQEIADECGVSRQTLQGHIAKLKDGNLIERHADAEPYRLTPLGHDLLEKFVEIEEEIVFTSLRESGSETLEDVRESLQEVKRLEDADIGFESPFTPEQWEILLGETTNEDAAE